MHLGALPAGCPIQVFHAPHSAPDVRGLRLALLLTIDSIEPLQLVALRAFFSAPCGLPGSLSTGYGPAVASRRVLAMAPIVTGALQLPPPYAQLEIPL